MTTTEPQPKVRHVAGSSKKYVLLQYPRAYCFKSCFGDRFIVCAEAGGNAVIGQGYSGSAAWANAADRLFSRAS